MPGIPEITGESELGTLNPVRESRRGGRDDAVADHRCLTLLPTSGMITSPLRLRLHDFSGEGERAPP